MAQDQVKLPRDGSDVKNVDREPHQLSRANETRRPKPRGHKSSRWRTVAIVLLAILAILVIARALMPWAVRDYVNRTLDRNPLYDGEIGEVEIHLWRGAYSIDDVRINKTTGNVPVPFFAAKSAAPAVSFSVVY